MKEIFFVFLGGGLGSVGRYLLGIWLNARFPNFPLGTFSANMLGCAVLGFSAYVLSQYFPENKPQAAFWLVGFCGGFTTFSSFIQENQRIGLLEFSVPSFFYFLGSLIMGFVALALGVQVAKWLT
jgi:CrcB protein